MVEEGYKQTEIGEIPKDWDVSALQDIATLINGRAYKQSELLLRGKYPVLRVGNFFTNDSWYYSNLDLEEKFYCKKGDLLFAWSCTYGAYIWDKEKTIFHYHIWKVVCKNVFSTMLYYILNNDIDNQKRTSQGGTMLHITKGFMETRLYAIPSTLEEQTAIATALYDIDDLISSLEKLIVKKQAIKQGTMQGLLTGKKRLDGFSGEWEEKTIGTCCNILNGDRGVNYPSGSDFIDIGVPFINAGHIKERRISFDNMDYISDEHYQKLSGAKIESGDVLFCLRGSLGKYAKIEFDYAAPASSLCVIRCKNNLINNNFLFHLMGCNIIKNQIENCNTGSSQPNLSAKNINDFYIPLPSIEEQKAIATILSDMDNEIEELKTKLEKYKQIKQGMMSELLTGRIRFI